MIPLGYKARDTISGFSGTITAHTRYISGCNQCLVVPKMGKDGAYREGQWFDEQRLAIDLKSKPLTLDNAGRLGFDAPAPRR